MIRATGVATAEGLRQATELGFVSRLARQASGSASYNATLGWRHNALELLVTSNLQGMAASLPAPLGQRRAQPAAVALSDRLAGASGPTGHLRPCAAAALTLGQLASAVFERDISGDAPKILRGAIGIGADTLDSVRLPTRASTPTSICRSSMWMPGPMCWPS